MINNYTGSINTLERTLSERYSLAIYSLKALSGVLFYPYPGNGSTESLSWPHKMTLSLIPVPF